ncbi:MAG TPA: DUF4124 domain-containing protein [Azoarcus sp.]|nr:DUF4124 domain-containing protein [Azoarcus sp.]
MLKFCLAVLLCVAALTPAHAEIYEWRENGKLYYGDRPPAGVEARLVRGSAPARAPVKEETATTETSTAQEQVEEMRIARENAAETEAQAEEERKRAEELEQTCQRARNQLAALESGQRVARFNEQGEREFLGDTARQQETERIRTFIDTNCDGQT